MKIKTVALIETASGNTHVFSRVYLPRVGLPIIGAILEKAGYEVEIFYQQNAAIDVDYLCRFDLIGISSLTTTVKEAYRLGELFRKRGKTVVMGGPHVSAKSEEALDYCDVVVRGEGELTIVALLEALTNGGGLQDIPGISFRSNGSCTDNPSLLEKVDMETLPPVSFSLCKGFSTPADYPPIVMCSRGCPYDCNFCSVTTTFGKKYRYRTTDQILEELRPFLKRSICFADDNFAAHTHKTKELLRAMIVRGMVPLRYSCQMRVNSARDTELLELMQKTNCRIAYVGMESVNPETLKRYNKGQSMDQIRFAIKKFQEYGIGLHGMFVLGSDDDTVDTIKSTVDFALESGLDTIQMCALTPFPGTAVYDEMKNENRIIHSRWELYDGLHVVIQPKKMTPFELQAGIIEQMERFYSWKNIFKIDLKKRWRLKYRFGGRYLVKRWKKENREYFAYLKTVR